LPNQPDASDASAIGSGYGNILLKSPTPLRIFDEFGSIRIEQYLHFQQFVMPPIIRIETERPLEPLSFCPTIRVSLIKKIVSYLFVNTFASDEL
jgi:hypothetical protein